MPDEVYLSIGEVAKRLGVEEKTVGKYVREGKLKAVKNPINGSIVGFTEGDIQEFLTGKPAEQKQEVRQPSDLSETLETKRQKELTEQAKLQNEQHRAKIEIDLRQAGYDSIDKGLADAEVKRKEALDELEMANRERASVRAELEAVAREKQKVINGLALAKERERLVNEKWADMMLKEEQQREFVEKYENWRKDLSQLAEYHKIHIFPCVKALLNVSIAIYNFADLLSRSRIDYTPLYNYIGTVMRQIDEYTDTIPADLTTPDESSQDIDQMNQEEALAE